MNFSWYFCLMLLGGSSLCYSLAAQAETEALGPKQHFGDLSFRIPASFTHVPQTPDGTLAFRDSDETESLSITLVEQYGEKNISSEQRAQLNKDILHSYRLVGFTDVELRSSEIFSFHSIPQLRASLVFAPESELFSRVCLISNAEKHYFLTTLGKQKLEPSIMDLSKQVCDAMTILPKVKAQVVSSSGRVGLFFSLTLGLGAILAFSLLLLRMKKSKI